MKKDITNLLFFCLSTRFRWILPSVLLCMSIRVSAQQTGAYSAIFELSGYNTAPFQVALNEQAIALRTVLPDSFQQDFKVYSCGFYTLQYGFKNYDYKTAYEEQRQAIAAQSKYFILFGRQSDARGLFTAFWVDFNLPTTGKMKCWSEESRDDVKDELYQLMDDLLIEGAPHTYHFAEKAVMIRLQEIVFEVTDCCNPNKGGETCDLEAGNYPFLEVWNAMGYNDELLSKDKRKSDGVVTVVNKNDTDGDGLEDLADPIVKSSTNTRKTEVDLIKLRLIKGNLATELASNEKVTFMCNSDKVRFYLDPCKSIPIAAMTLNSDGWFTLDIPLDSIQQGSTIYVEAITASTSAKDITIKLSQLDKQVNKRYNNSVKVTALWVELKKAWYENSTTPIPGQGELVNLLSTEFLADRINNSWISKSGQRYGFGSFLKADIINGTPHDVTPFVASGSDKQIGGRILFDFVIQPSDQESMKAIEIDCTRRKTTELFKIFDTDFKLNKIDQRSYTASNEPELSNDDENDDSDEVPVATNGHIYCADIPASYIVDYANIERSFKINIMNFQEYIRIRPSEIDKNNVFGGDAKVMGTRCTNLIDWHCIYYLKRGVGTNNAKWELDISPISVSSPRKEAGFMGEGEIDIKTSTSTLTSSYTLKYSLGNKWIIENLRDLQTLTLDGILLPNSTKMEWKKLFAGLEIRITSGDKPFAVGDTYSFSTYKASDKKNIIGLGTVSNNPRM